MNDTKSKLSNELILSIAGSEGMYSNEYGRNAGDACIRFARTIERAVTTHAPQGDANPFNGPLADRIYKAITGAILEGRDAIASGAGEWLPTVEAVAALPDGIRKYVQQLEAEVERAATAQKEGTGVLDAKDTARIANLRAALKEISEVRFGYEGDCGTTRIAEDALYADEQVAIAAATPEQSDTTGGKA